MTVWSADALASTLRKPLFHDRHSTASAWLPSRSAGLALFFFFFLLSAPAAAACTARDSMCGISV